MKEAFDCPSMRYCGLCNDTCTYTLQHVSDLAEDNDILNLYDTAAGKVAVTSINQIQQPRLVVDPDGTQRVCIYIDGSCELARHPRLAHARWGVVYDAKIDSELNMANAVAGPVQTSYRAELRAMPQALASCKLNACIYSDCKAIATQVTQ